LAAAGSFAQGGFTGEGGRYQPAGVVHAGEVVIPQPIVKEHGLEHFAQYFGGRMPGYAGGGAVTSFNPGVIRTAGVPSGSNVSVTVLQTNTRNEERDALARDASTIVIDRLNRRGNRFKA
jgi:phage-related minor tail protein